MKIGVIADTHGLMHPRVAEVFAGVDHIIHAGDIGGDHVIEALEEIAPTIAVRGNNDDSAGEDIIRAEVGDLRILLTHILPRPQETRKAIAKALETAPADIVIFGHSHLPHNEVIGGVRFFNPASAGPRRFDYPVSVGLLKKTSGEWTAVHVALDDRSVGALKLRMNQLSQ